MTAHQEAESGKRRAGAGRRQESSHWQREDGRVLVTKQGLAVALGVSLRTVERMLKDEDVDAVRVHGWLVRFDLEEVLRTLRENAATRKHGRGALLVTADHTTLIYRTQRRKRRTA